MKCQKLAADFSSSTKTGQKGKKLIGQIITNAISELMWGSLGDKDSLAIAIKGQKSLQESLMQTSVSDYSNLT